MITITGAMDTRLHRNQWSPTGWVSKIWRISELNPFEPHCAHLCKYAHLLFRMHYRDSRVRNGGKGGEVLWSCSSCSSMHSS